MATNNYEQNTITMLKNIARERGLRGYSRLKKSELIRKLREPTTLRDHTRTQLIHLARERGLTRYHSLKKAELIQRLKEHGSTILDRGINARMANVPFLTPTPYTTPQASLTPSSNADKNLIGYLKKKATPQATLTQYTPPQATPTQYTPPQATPTPSSNADKNLIGYLDNIKEIPKSVSSRVEKLKEEINNIYEQMKLFELKRMILL